GRLENLLARHHHSQIDDLVVVALQDDADDILTDIVDIALHGCDHDSSVAARGAVLALLDERDQMGYRPLHHACAFHDLRQEHLARAEQIADDVHAIHQRAFDDLQRTLEGAPRFLRVLDHEIIDPLDQSMLESLRHRERAPLQVRLTLATGAFSLEPGSHFQQLLRCIRTPVQHDVLHHGAQIRGDLLVDGELAGVDDSHVHASGDRVVEEHRVHRLAYRVVAAEGERDVAHPTAHHHTRHPRLDLASRLDKSQPITVVFLDTRGDGKDVRIEDDVLGRKDHLLDQDPVGTLADRHPALDGIRLALLIEGHDHDRGTIQTHLAGVLDEHRFAFLQADRVDDRLALHALEPRLDHTPFRGVEH